MKASRRSPTRQRIDPEVLRARFTPFAKVITGILVLVAFGLVGDRVAKAARKHPRYLVDPSLLVEEGLPNWMPQEVVADVRSQLRAVAPRSIFAVEFENGLRADLMSASWWIEDVRAVQKLFPNQVRVDLVMRKPVATIDRDDWSYLVDAEGRCLYREPVQRQSAFGFVQRLQIRGASPDKALTLGELASDPQVIAGARVAAEVLALCPSERRILPRVQIVAVDVAHPTTGFGAIPGIVHLVTERGILVRWGKAQKDPGGARLEQTVEIKLRALERIEARFPSLSGLDEVRVDMDNGVPRYRIGSGDNWTPLDEQKDPPTDASKP